MWQLLSCSWHATITSSTMKLAGCCLLGGHPCYTPSKTRNQRQHTHTTLTASLSAAALPARSCGCTARNLNSCSRAMNAATLSGLYGTSNKLTTKDPSLLPLLLPLQLSLVPLCWLLSGEMLLLLELLPSCCWLVVSLLLVLAVLIGSQDKLAISRCMHGNMQEQQQVALARSVKSRWHLHKPTIHTHTDADVLLM